jgi:hypothetical protein
MPALRKVQYCGPRQFRFATALTLQSGTDNRLVAKSDKPIQAG